MRAFEIQESFGLDSLRLTDRPEPEPGPGQVQIEMRSVSLNYRDLLMVRGHYNPRQPLPLIPCSDGAGVVTALGEGVSDLEVGDRVATIFSQTWLAGEPTAEKLRGTLGGPLDGTLAEFFRCFTGTTCKIVGDKRGNVFADSRHRADKDADQTGSNDVLPVVG